MGMVDRPGFEPGASRVQAERSSRLSYRPTPPWAPSIMGLDHSAGLKRIPDCGVIIEGLGIILVEECEYWLQKAS